MVLAKDALKTHFVQQFCSDPSGLFPACRLFATAERTTFRDGHVTHYLPLLLPTNGRRHVFAHVPSILRCTNLRSCTSAAIPSECPCGTAVRRLEFAEGARKRERERERERRMRCAYNCIHIIEEHNLILDAQCKSIRLANASALDSLDSPFALPR